MYGPYNMAQYNKHIRGIGIVGCIFRLQLHCITIVLFRVSTRVPCSSRFLFGTFKYLHARGQYQWYNFFRSFLFKKHIKLMIHYSNKDRNNESSNGVLNDEL